MGVETAALDIIMQAIEEECDWVSKQDAEDLDGYEPGAVLAAMEGIAARIRNREGGGATLFAGE